MNIQVNNQIHLTPFEEDFFFNLIKEKKEALGKISNWAIRNEAGEFIGSIGLLRKNPDGNPYRDQFGYWLAEPYWGKGIMTKVVKAFTEYCFEHENLNRIEATVFLYNPGSMRVLEKAGYEKEGYLKKAYFKNDQFLDGVLYAKIK